VIPSVVAAGHAALCNLAVGDDGQQLCLQVYSNPSQGHVTLREASQQSFKGWEAIHTTQSHEWVQRAGLDLAPAGKYGRWKHRVAPEAEDLSQCCQQGVLTHNFGSS